MAVLPPGSAGHDGVCAAALARKTVAATRR